MFVLGLSKSHFSCHISYLAFSLTLDIGVLLRGGEGGRGVRGSPQSSLSLRPPSDAVRYSSSDEKSTDRGVRGVLGTIEGSCSNLQATNYDKNKLHMKLLTLTFQIINY